jgi:hypothetical protein
MASQEPTKSCRHDPPDFYRIENQSVQECCIGANKLKKKTVRPTSLPVRVFSLDSWKRPFMSAMVGY